MLAHLYIIPQSFFNNANFNAEQIEAKVHALSQDVIRITNYKDDNKLFTNYSEIYPVQFYLTHTVGDFLCKPSEIKQSVDRDLVNAFLKIFEKSDDTTFTSTEVLDLLTENDETLCHAIIAFHPIADVTEEAQVIYGLEGWYKFRRHFLAKFPNNTTFIDECVKYFPQLFFHEDNRTTVTRILPDFSKSIVKNLGHLNDTFTTYKFRKFDNETIKYDTFTQECKLEAPAASKDLNDAKKVLTYQFSDNLGEPKDVICYPHLRLSKSNDADDVTFYHHRIYFHEGFSDVAKGKILIGHIGLHRQ